MLLSALLACVEAPPTEAPVDETAYLKGTAALAQPSGGTCPDLGDGGPITFNAAGVDRDLRVIVPDSGAEGAPVVFVWHPLGATAQQIVQWMGLNAWADEVGAVLVVPDSLDANLFEWQFLDDPDEENLDLVLYDDLRTCLYEQMAVDLGRVTSTGMSAGGLWTTYLGIHRGDTLATILPLSGGTGSVVAYDTPASTFPAMLVYGGEDDHWGGGGIDVDFGAATLELAEQLADDDHFVVLCDHGLGHTIPDDAPDMMATWLLGHTYAKASPWADGDLSDFPSYCEVYAQ